MSISQRILLLLSLALAALFAVSALGVWEQQQAKARFEATLDNLIPSNRDINAANAAFIDMRGGLIRHLLAPSAAEKQAQEAVVANAESRMFAALDHYERNNLSNETDRQLLAADRKTFAEYRQQMQALFQYSRANDLAAAYQSINSGEMSVAAAAFRKALNDHAEFNYRLADEMRQTNQDAFQSALTLSLAIGALALALLLIIGVQMLRNIRRGLGSIQHTLETVDRSLDFTLRAPVSQNDEIGQTAASFNNLLSRLQDNLRSLRQESEQVGDAARALSQTASQVAAAASSQSMSSANVAATVEQMTVSINHVADRAGETHQLADNAGRMAQSGSVTISQTIGDIRQIAQSVDAAAGSIRELDAFSNQVTSVVGVIQDIADQTNLLALNASIEAARAGEMGRGFAVVADEVRMLAERTTQSTKEISTTLAAMQERSRSATTQMRSAESLVRNGVERADTADQAIKQIGSATDATVAMVGEISAAIKQQGAATNSIAAQIESIAQMSEESSAAAQETSHNAARLDQLAKNQIDTLASYKL
nr:methyl-accepting chemotaxis protein [Chromobacterium sp. ASV5]